MNVWAVMALLFALCLALVFIFLPETARAGSAPGGACRFRHRAEGTGPSGHSAPSRCRLVAHLRQLAERLCTGSDHQDDARRIAGRRRLHGERHRAHGNSLHAGLGLGASPPGPGPHTRGGRLHLCHLPCRHGAFKQCLACPRADPDRRAGAAAILSVPISYFQDMFPGRPGLGTSLYPMQTFLGTGAAAGIFAVASHFTTYQGTAMAGACVTLAAGSSAGGGTARAHAGRA